MSLQELSCRWHAVPLMSTSLSSLRTKIIWKAEDLHTHGMNGDSWDAQHTSSATRTKTHPSSGGSRSKRRSPHSWAAPRCIEPIDAPPARGMLSLSAPQVPGGAARFSLQHSLLQGHCLLAPWCSPLRCFWMAALFTLGFPAPGLVYQRYWLTEWTHARFWRMSYRQWTRFCLDRLPDKMAE
ncbi:uncharacterized protein LOC107514074 isoform X2 [Rousettus aegyptiacus]|uniref:uncharacterized protein LOC107514074 isoform X2 n=1 Tax=Rousettus aegyptiacus TaxID=9407 RepID=UPI00168CDABB|nr:uncharacterized protein LOC107514074 isoform X2 [Rousettus aegyptiacus]XP_036080849.1 uncharacterized protein LOC107514074 isoform X2 [Rousettus aegyptiacus]XP_036080850.1 uncharacterized protein LOC107514074 isoform X2 [Rousettus aegyptiacus]XP_036080851.1 uncharacterized protein LOC107514074 isoform X2 [Rousettus aegyptiacus]